MRSLEFTGGANRTRICDLFDVNSEKRVISILQYPSKPVFMRGSIHVNIDWHAQNPSIFYGIVVKLSSNSTSETL